MKKVEIKIVITDDVEITGKPAKSKNKNPTIEFSQPDGNGNKKKVFILKVPTVEEQQAWIECIQDSRDKVSFPFSVCTSSRGQTHSCVLQKLIGQNRSPSVWDEPPRAVTKPHCI